MAGKNCNFSHNRDPMSENYVCKYFLKGNCKFGAKCSLSHSFLALDRKTSALMPGGGGAGGNFGTGGRARLERRASSGAILNSVWPSEPLSPPYASSLPQQPSSIQFGGTSNVEFTMGRSASQLGFLKPALNRAASENFRASGGGMGIGAGTGAGAGASTGSTAGPYPHSPLAHDLAGAGNSYSPFAEDDTPGYDTTHVPERMPMNPLGILEHRVRQHLAAPLPIRQRSLPDIFKSSQIYQEGNAAPSSPFYHANSKALFLSVSCEGEAHPPSPLRLHSIPEMHNLYTSHGGNGSSSGNGSIGGLNNTSNSVNSGSNSGSSSSNSDAIRRRDSSAGIVGIVGREGSMPLTEDYSESDDDMSSDQGFLPSSLNDLLTTNERQRRQSRQDEIDQRIAVLPSPSSGSLQDEKEEEEEGKYSHGGSSGASAMSQAMGFVDPRSRFQRSYSGLEHHGYESLDATVSPLTAVPPTQSQPLFPYPTSRASHDDEDQHQHQHLSHPYGLNMEAVPGRKNMWGSRAGSVSAEATTGSMLEYKYNKGIRNGPSDPFCPFPHEVEGVQFPMDDDAAVNSTLGYQDLGMLSSIRTSASGNMASPTMNEFGMRKMSLNGLSSIGGPLDSTSPYFGHAKELNRAVGSRTLSPQLQSQLPTHPLARTLPQTFQQTPQGYHGSMTPMSLVSREEEADGLSMDFSTLSLGPGAGAENVNGGLMSLGRRSSSSVTMSNDSAHRGTAETQA
ncbi:hypothetical protein BGW38_001043 [Lunasporangiospora selenospora]|uniref:C3H1-type domain-containing protein n=1 Tax=Lunasporangiospora selenospora TaxID=979761 RepID=A0A9P6KDS9_9FUNG|nr:hypothetical protein BGW38_001043 [Lunasporangiospora selenospora]